MLQSLLSVTHSPSFSQSCESPWDSAAPHTALLVVDSETCDSDGMVDDDGESVGAIVVVLGLLSDGETRRARRWEDATLKKRERCTGLKG